MKVYQLEFIELAIASQALKFGQFTLKSGRISPYFFNAGQFYEGQALAKLGEIYADCLMDNGAKFNMLFGPAYKGIPLVAAVSIALANKYQMDLPYAFNRKEAKTHGEGGSLVGAPLQKEIAVVDDVITAGTAMREVLSIVKAEAASVATIIVGVDRQERGTGDMSAIQELQRTEGVSVISVIQLDTIIEYLNEQGENEFVDQITAYRDRYGVH